MDRQHVTGLKLRQLVCLTPYTLLEATRDLAEGDRKFWRQQNTVDFIQTPVLNCRLKIAPEISQRSIVKPSINWRGVGAISERQCQNVA